MYTEKSILDYGLGPSTTRKEEKPRKRDRVVASEVRKTWCPGSQVKKVDSV